MTGQAANFIGGLITSHNIAFMNGFQRRVKIFSMCANINVHPIIAI